MYDMIAIGDTSHNVFMEMTDETAHIHCELKHESCQICFNYADKIPVHALHDTIGGNSANAAVSFSRLDFHTAFYTHVGHDDQGARIIREMKEGRVDTGYIVTDKDKGTNYSAVINLHGERTILVYHEHRHYVLPKLQAAKWVYLSSMGTGSEEIFPDIIHYVKEHRVNLIYQPGTFQLQYGAKKTSDLLKASKIIYVNKEEAELYLEIEATDNMRIHLDGLRKLGPEIAVVTDGPKGAYASDGQSYLYLGIIDEAPRLEATGAGDAFSSAMTAALASGIPLGEAMRWGQCQSSSVIQLPGAQAGLLYKKQMQLLLERYPTLQPAPLDEQGHPVLHHHEDHIPGAYPDLASVK